MASPYCIPEDVAEAYPCLTGDFSPSTTPTLFQVDRWIIQAGRELDTAMSKGKHYGAITNWPSLPADRTTINDVDNDWFQWLRDANIQGALQKLWAWYHSFQVTFQDRQRVSPYEAAWMDALKVLQTGQVQWTNKCVEPQTEQFILGQDLAY